MISTRSPLLTALVLFLAPMQVSAEESTTLGISTGFYDTAAWTDAKGDFEALEVGIQYRGRNRWFLGLGPMLGATITEDSSYWLYVGARRPFPLGENWIASLGFGASYYEQGDGKDLGYDLEFRSSIELAYRLDGGSTLGFEYYHLSNASISDVNPGSNSFVLVWALPLGR